MKWTWWPWRRVAPPTPPAPVRKCRVEEDDQDQGGTYLCTPAVGPRRAEPRGVDLGPLRVPVAAVRRGTPQPGWLIAGALAALFTAVAFIAVFIGWWIMG